MEDQMQISMDSLFNTDGTPIATTATTTTASDDDNDGSTLEKTDFLELLCTQLKYQDPLNPQSNTDMAAQLAQYSSLESMQNIEAAINNQTEVFNSAVTALQYSALSSTNSSSISLIGKTVRLQQTTLDYEGYEDDLSFNVCLGENDSAVISLVNEAGETVRTLSAENSDDTNSTTVTWDGLNENGEQCDPGTYTLAISGADTSSAGDEGTSVYSFVEGTVSGVRFTDNGPLVMIDGQELSVSNILAVT
jgi:flagellar basal-body rod modification protein FlgD